MENKDLSKNENNENHNECTQDKIEIQTQNACGCETAPQINYIPNEYFYNSCECDNCDCDSTEDGDEMICSCGFMGNPMGINNNDSYSCQCNNLNIFD